MRREKGSSGSLPQISIGNLRVFHSYQYRSASGKKKLYNRFLRTVGAFSPSTCTRHIAIFNADTAVKDEEGLVKYLEGQSVLFQDLKGIDAYSFLLSWMSGVESRKIGHNDHFVLGAARKEWASFEKTEGARKILPRAEPYSKLMQCLFGDASKLRSIIQEDYDGVTGDKLVILVRDMAKKCAYARSLGTKPDYKNLSLAEEEYQELMIEKLRIEQERREKYAAAAECKDAESASEVISVEQQESFVKYHSRAAEEMSSFLTRLEQNRISNPQVNRSVF